MLARFSSPFGAHGGEAIRVFGSKRSGSARSFGRQLVAPGVIAARQDRTPERRAPSDAVDPRDRIAVVGVALEHARHHGVEVGAALVGGAEQRRLHPEQPEDHLGDDAGEPHGAGGAPEELRVGVGRDGHDSLGRVQHERLDVVGDAAFDVVVLPVDVGGERTAHGDEPRPGGDGDEEAEREDEAQERVEADAGGDAHGATGGVDVDHVGERPAVEHRAAGVLRRVAVAAAEPARDDPALAGVGEQVVDARVAGDRDQVGGARSGAAPSGEDLGARVVVHGHSGTAADAEHERDHPDDADHLEHTVGEHDFFRCTTAALLDDEPVAEYRGHERDDRQVEPERVAALARVLERPDAVRGDHHSRRDRADEAEERRGVLTERAAVTVRSRPELDLLGVTLPGDDEQ